MKSAVSSNSRLQVISFPMVIYKLPESGALADLMPLRAWDTIAPFVRWIALQRILFH